MKRMQNVLQAPSYDLRATTDRRRPKLGVRRSHLLASLMACALAICISGRLMAEEPETTIKVDVKLVNIFVTVTDARGAPVANLQKENFLLKEDGKEQKIAIFSRESALPLSIVLAVDTSLSTRKDLPLELISARKFAHTIVRPQDGLAVYKFSETVSQMVPFTSDLKKIDEGIDHPRNGSATALYDAVFLGSQALSRRDKRAPWPSAAMTRHRYSGAESEFFGFSPCEAKPRRGLKKMVDGRCHLLIREGIIVVTSIEASRICAKVLPYMQLGDWNLCRTVCPTP